MPQSILKQLKRMADQSIEWKDRYKEGKWPFDKSDTVFLPVRHFNSATPITPGPYNSVPYNIAERPLHYSYGGALNLQPVLIGGGYFLGHKGRGIAIDPGYEFVDVLHRYHKVTAYHINTVVITHDHMDHHADLETIINLRIGSEKGPLKIVTNSEVIDAYGLEKRQWVDGVNIQVYDVTEDIKSGTLVELIDGVTAKILPCMHWQRVREIKTPVDQAEAEKILQKHFMAFGLQLIIEENSKRILISGDTLFPIRKKIDLDEWAAYGNGNSPYGHFINGRKLGWKYSEFKKNEALLSEMIDLRCQQMVEAYRVLEKSDIVCLHLGSLEKGFSKQNFDERNVEINSEEKIKELLHDPCFCYEGFHLGLMGSLRLLEVLNEKEPKGFNPSEDLIILTEFGEELLGNRQNLCTILSKLAKSLPGWEKEHPPSVIPSEVTLHIRLDSEKKKTPLGIMCSYCNKAHKWTETIGEEGPGEIISYLVRGATNGTFPNCSYLK